MNKFQQNIVLVVGIIIISLYLVISLFIFPYADDFTYALKGRLPNFIQTVLNERETWNGRYTSNFILIGSPLNWGGLTGYRIMPFLLLGFSYLGLFVGFRKLGIKAPYFISTLVLVTILSSLPNITEGIYWLSGAWTYIPASILIFVLFSILFSQDFKTGDLIQAFIIIILGSGFNELFGLIGLGILGAKYLVSKNKWVLGLIIIQSLLFYYVWTAPGNNYRSSFFEDNHQIGHTIKFTFLYSVRFIGEWLFNPLVYLLGYIFITESRFRVNLPALRKPIIILVLLLFPTVLACFGPIWSTGILGQHRTANMACFLFFPILFLVLIENKDFLSRYLKLSRKIVFPLTIVVLFGWKNNYFLLQDLISGEQVRYSSQLAERVSFLKSCKSEECFVPALIDKPSTFNVYSLEPNSDHWINKSYQLFYDSGRVIPETNR